MFQSYLEGTTLFKFGYKLFGNYKNSPYRYSENQLAKYDDIHEYHIVLRDSMRTNRIKTSENIEEVARLKLGASIKDIRATLKVKPIVQTHNNSGLRRHVLLFKLKMNGQKIKIEAHFHKNKLFFFKYIFSYANELERELIIDNLANQYKVDSNQLKVNKVIDDNSNIIKLNESMDLSINFIQQKSSFFQRLKNNYEPKSSELPLSYGVNLGVQ